LSEPIMARSSKIRGNAGKSVAQDDPADAKRDTPTKAENKKRAPRTIHPMERTPTGPRRGQ
jgi:hypothetical protein